MEEMIKVPKADKFDEHRKETIRKRYSEALQQTPLFVPSVWVIKPEPPATHEEEEAEGVIQTLKGYDLEDTLFSVEFLAWEDKRAILKECCEVNAEEVQKIAGETVGQWENKVFLQFKKYRLTASNFGYILGAIHRNSFPKTFWQRILDQNDLEKVSTKPL